MKVIYTESGMEALRGFQEKQKLLLENLICEEKYVLGDELVEVTASDIKKVSSAFEKIGKRRRPRNLLDRILFLLPFVFVAYVMGIGWFLPTLFPSVDSELAASPKLRGGLIILVSMIVSVFFAWWNKEKKRREDFLNAVSDFEPSSHAQSDLAFYRTIENENLSRDLRALNDRLLELRKEMDSIKTKEKQLDLPTEPSSIRE